MACFRHVECEFSVGGLDQYNELLQVKLESINNYLQTKLIDLNTLTNYLNKLNDYLTFYPIVDLPDEQVPLDVCLPNRTAVCWDIEDTIDFINADFSNKPSLQWLGTGYNLKNINIQTIYQNTFTLNTTLASLRDLTKLDGLSDGLYRLTNLNGLGNSLPSLKSFTRFKTLPNFQTLATYTSLTNLNLNRAFFISYFEKFDNEELKNLLVSFNLFMPFVCSAFLFLLCIQNQHRRKLIELNQLVRKIECISGLQQIKEDMRALANVIDELKLDAKQNQELKIKLQQMLNNEFKAKQQITIQQHIQQANSTGHHLGQNIDVNGNLVKSMKGDHDLSSTFTEQIGRINQQLKLNQLEQSKLKYMVCKTIERYDNGRKYSIFLIIFY